MKPPAGGAPAARQDRRPTHDQLYLAGRLNQDEEFHRTIAGAKVVHKITPAAIQRWNLEYGVQRVSDVLRAVHGFATPVNPYAYVDAVLKGE